MTSKPPELSARAPNPLPIETVRDLLGIVRALYAFQRAKGNHGYARELQGAGGRLREALALAIRKGNADAHAEAWRLADDAIATIARVQGSLGDDLATAVRLASARVQRRHFNSDDRRARREARIKRG
ncbi:MAG TPA: hypothetical protein VGC79_34125 [Polyangiaceae bacterium]